MSSQNFKSESSIWMLAVALCENKMLANNLEEKALIYWNKQKNKHNDLFKKVRGLIYKSNFLSVFNHQRKFPFLLSQEFTAFLLLIHSFLGPKQVSVTRSGEI